jgi:transposase
MGAPSLAPGRYFRLLLIGYFEGIDSERGIAWRAADSLGLRGFLGVGLEQMPPDHSTLVNGKSL